MAAVFAMPVPFMLGGGPQRSAKASSTNSGYQRLPVLVSLLDEIDGGSQLAGEAAAGDSNQSKLPMPMGPEASVTANRELSTRTLLAALSIPGGPPPVWALPPLSLAPTRIHYQPHTPGGCLPPGLKHVLELVAERFGEVQVLSTHRDPNRNRRAGGARHSMHLDCRAVDFKVIGAKTQGLTAFLRGRPEIGGLKRYPLGFFHIDDGPERTW
jgi:uncharacterized protein YcbK (DUF882 family)